MGKFAAGMHRAWVILTPYTSVQYMRLDIARIHCCMQTYIMHDISAQESRLLPRAGNPKLQSLGLPGADMMNIFGRLCAEQGRMIAWKENTEHGGRCIIEEIAEQ